MTHLNTDNDWWKDTFSKKYLDTYIDVTPQERTDEEVDFLKKNILKDKEAKVIDLSSGYGRHSIPLAKAGFNMVSLDQSKLFIEMLQAEAQRENLPIEALHQDIRDLDIVSKFDFALSMFTSFGYFSDHENADVIRRIANSLKVGGYLFLDLGNTYRLINFLLERTAETRNHPTKIATAKQSDGLEITTEHELDIENCRWLMRRTWEADNEKHSYNTSVRLYNLPELTKLLEASGFVIEKTWGDFKEAPLTAFAPRMLILAKKLR